MAHLFTRWLPAALAAAVLASASAHAQRADENAVTAADDAFGTTVGSQQIGLYDLEHVRGFSPRAAGNLRIEGLYFDQQTYATNRCLVVEQTVRVGLAAQFFDTPSPTGIANFTLHPTGPANGASVLVTRGPFLLSALELDGQRVAGSGKGGVGLCYHAQSNFDIDLARRSHLYEVGAVGRWRPSPQLEVIPFWGQVRGREHDVLPTVYINGTDPPPAFIERLLPAQRWARWGWSETTAGALARSVGNDAWSWAGGLFLSDGRYPVNYNDIYDDLRADGTVRHAFDVTPPVEARSVSGEMRLLHRGGTGRHMRLWSLALRGRNLSRSFGGDWFRDYTDEICTVSVANACRVRIDDFRAIPEPTVSFNPGSEDHVSQLGLGASFEQRWTGRGSISLGLQKVDYRRSIVAPSADPSTFVTTRQHSTPTLANLRVTLNARHTTVVYAGYTRGLEDSAPAPNNAANAFATAPATATWQVDAGVRMTPHDGLQFVAGVFEIQKAYFNLDTNGNYVQLGHIRHRGVEASATIAAANGLTAVLGGVWLRPGVTLGNAAADPNGGAAIGTVPLLLDANLDYAPQRWGPLSAGLHVNRVSSRPAGQAQLGAFETVSVTVRYRTSLFGRVCVLRLDADDLNDAIDPMIQPSGIVLPEQGRRLALTATVDL
ncbi:MAG: hypothetical protein JSR15_02005 [Proteobacteria bacterium]|nr:hypothetical protein [Pseudomonadota bacterium]